MEAYQEHESRVVEADDRFKHVMALTLDGSSRNRQGVVRCITSREGDVTVAGFLDRSELYIVEGTSLERFDISNRLVIAHEKEVVNKLAYGGWDCIGLEDPDIWIDEATGLTHLYFTLPFRQQGKHTAINLGHAMGRDLDSLVMTEPTLLCDQMGGRGHMAKEASIAPLNTQGTRFNLIESSDASLGDNASVVQVAIAKDMGRPWQYGEVLFHPHKAHLTWIGGHASPGPLLPRSFIDVGKHKLLGIINGREANKKVGNQVRYGIFSVGLFIYDYEQGAIEWVSPEPLIRDSEARTITFASHFVETRSGEGTLYAHVDDSFVRAYSLFSEGIRQLLP